MAIDPVEGGQDGGSDKYACWYEQAAELSQGTILRDVRVFEELPNSTDEAPRVAPRRIDGIVLTQSCDILKKSQTRLLISEIQAYRQLADEHQGFFRTSKWRKQLADGVTIAEFILPPAPGIILDWSLVNFRELHTVRRASLIDRDGGYIGLDSPYREHLGQAFARFMMRVGLPTVIESAEFEQYPL